MITKRPGRRCGAGTTAVVVCCALLSIGWLALGVAAAVAHQFPGVAAGLSAAAAGGGRALAVAQRRRLHRGRTLALAARG